ncbi:cytochrome P450 [Actinospica sp. MGRD01-02]|uniref:Cytochrome P450 n=1 Tax=Actinospica acidithermotolerans TaxID=2828514 RepID=A0A941EBI0_9ACTN|nr:cytochrome P450 [Actinospica acidithermotolerans]MBR7827275.1 cytochrome P450 [Actinospica acidithermotolerans]
MTEQPASAPTASPDAPQLFDRAFIDDPYPAYAWLREHAPVHRAKLPNGVEAYLVTRYDDVKSVLADPRLSKNAAASFPGWQPGRTGIPGEHRSGIAAHLLNLDPPDHTRLRRLVSKAFTPRRIADFEPSIARIADELLDACEKTARDGDGTVDLIRGYACPLPVAVILEMLGVPPEDQAIFHEWAFGVVDRGSVRGGVGRSVKRIRGYLRTLIHKKRLNPGEDLLTALVRASDHGEHLSEDEAASMAFILLFAGFETTINLIGNGTLALLTHPEQRARLQANPALLDGAVEELLRYDGPVEFATWRFTTAPITVGGVGIPAGEPVLAVLAAADRDPRRFADPDTLDLGRPAPGHLALGHGIHFCIGAPLARLEGRIGFERLLARHPEIALAAPAESLRWHSGLIMRGVHELPVRLSPEGRRRIG